MSRPPKQVMPSPSKSPSLRGAQSAPTAILVLGMHRSGTSAVARMLNLCGADLGRDLLPPKQDNERGFWENSALLALHEQFLAESGLKWYDLAALPEGWREDAPARRFVVALPDALSSQFAGSPLFLVKDPRLSLLAPLWIDVLERRGVVPTFVITIRDPDEVAASLAKRDGFSPARSHLLWLQHVLEAERATRGHARVFVHYEALLGDWRSELGRISAALGVTWPKSGADAEAGISAFIAPSLRHHRGDAADSGRLPELVREAYDLLRLAAASKPVPAAAFDAVGSTFEQALRVAGPLLRDLSDQLARSNDEHVREIDQARAAIDDYAGQIAKAREAIEDYAVRIAAARATIDDYAAQNAAARAAIDDYAAQVAQARDAHAERDRIESELRAEVAARADEIARARANIDALAADLDVAREGFAANAREIDAARANINTLTSEVAQATVTIALKDREIDAARNNINILSSELALSAGVIALKDSELDAARRNIDAFVAEIARATTAIDAKEHELAGVRELIAAKAAEIDAARANIDDLVAQIDRAREGFAAKDAEIAGLVTQIDRAREGFAAKDAEIDAARNNIDSLVTARDGLAAELAALRASRWYRLGRRIGLVDKGRR